MGSNDNEMVWGFIEGMSCLICIDGRNGQGSLTQKQGK